MIRRKRTKNDTPWPAHWEVAFEHDGMVSRESEFQIRGSREWYLFDRFVVNLQTEKSWVDGFRQKPYDCFMSIHPELVTKTRKRRPVANGTEN